MFIDGTPTSECKESRKIRAFYSRLRSDGAGMERHKTRLSEKKEKNKKNDRLKKLVFPVTQRAADIRPEIKVAATFTSKCGEEECVVCSRSRRASSSRINYRKKIESSITIAYRFPSVLSFSPAYIALHIIFPCYTDY